MNREKRQSIKGSRTRHENPIPNALPSRQHRHVVATCCSNTRAKKIVIQDESGQPAQTTASSKMALRFGRRKDRLDMRWFVAAETFFNPAHRVPDENKPTGYRVARNDFEWISS
jgi:hypothetical protein